MSSLDLKLEDLKKTFEGSDLLPAEKAINVRKILNETSEDTLKMLAQANINFVSLLAKNILEEVV